MWQMSHPSGTGVASLALQDSPPFQPFLRPFPIQQQDELSPSTLGLQNSTLPTLLRSFELALQTMWLIARE